MNNNKKYLVLIILILIPHITSTTSRKKDDPTDSNYSTEQIRKDYGKSLPLFLKNAKASKSVDTVPSVFLAIEDKFAIKDEEEIDHVKIITRGITSDSWSVVAGSWDFVSNVKQNNKTIKVVYDDSTRFLAVSIVMKHVKVEKKEQASRVETLYHAEGIWTKLQSSIKLSQRKVDYDKEKQILTITIPRVGDR